MCTLTISVLGPKYGNRPRVKSMALFAQLVLAALWLEQVSEGKKQRQDANMARRSAWKGSIRIYHFWWKCLRALWKSGHRRLGFPVCIVVIVMAERSCRIHTAIGQGRVTSNLCTFCQ